MWDVGDPTALETVMVGNTPATDLFCSGHAFLGDGSLLTLGGVDRVKKWMYGPSSGPYGHGQSYRLRTDLGGIPGADLFWEPLPSLSEARWYPTGIGLETGGVLMSGHTGIPVSSGRTREELPSLAAGWLAPDTNWRLNSVECEFLIPQLDGLFMYDYPRMHLLSNAFVIYTDGESNTTPNRHVAYFLPRPTFWPPNCPAGTTPDAAYQWERGAVNPLDTEEPWQAGGNSVHLVARVDANPGQIKEVVYLIGGTKHAEEDLPCPCLPGPSHMVRRMVNPDPSKSWEIGDSGDPSKPPTLNFGRVNSNTVILDGSLLVVGGADHDEQLICDDEPAGVGCAHRRRPERLRPPEIFEDASAPQWKKMAKQTHKRQYHSVAGLLPDGRVFSAGGTWGGNGDPSDNSVPPSTGRPRRDPAGPSRSAC